VAILGLLALFTHIHLFWVAALLLAMIDLPDFGTPLRSIAGSVEKIANAAPDQGSTAQSETRSAPPTAPAGPSETRHSGTAKAREPSDV
jgi:hypothetical protein